MYTIEPYKIEHLTGMECRLWEKPNKEIRDKTPEYAQEILDKGPAFTGFYNGEILAVGGVALIWQGVGHAWIIGTPLIGAHGIFFARSVRKKLAIIAAEKGLHRIQATVICGVPRLIRFVEFCGFEFESRLRNYGPLREDHLMFSRLL